MGAVGEWIAVTPVGRVLDIRETVRAGGGVGGHVGVRLTLCALDDLKIRRGRFHWRCFIGDDFFDVGQGRRIQAQPLQEFSQAVFPAPGVNHHAGGIVPHPATDPASPSDAPDRRAKAHALHRTRHANTPCRHQQMRGSCSPASQSTILLPPKLVCICTNPCSSSMTSKRVFGLVIDFGTSQSPKSTRPLTTYLCPSRPGYPALRNNFASSLLLRTWLPMTGRRVRRPTLFSLWRKARRENSAASRLLESTSLRFALHGWQRQ